LAAGFSLFLLAYWQKAEAIDGSWTPQAVRRAAMSAYRTKRTNSVAVAMFS
jgi:hypothetical protein